MRTLRLLLPWVLLLGCVEYVDQMGDDLPDDSDDDDSDDDDADDDVSDDDVSDDDLSDDDTSIPAGELSVAEAHAAVLGAVADAGIGTRMDAGDLDGDGVDDLVVQAGTSDDRTIYGFHGPLAGVVGAEQAGLVVTGGLAYPEPWLSGVADLDRDGTDDLLVGVWDGGPPVSSFALLGPLAGALTPADAQLWFRLDEPGCTLMSVESMPAGDLDGDGAGDVAVAVWGFCGDDSSDVTSSVFLFLDPLLPGEVDLLDADVRLRWDGAEEVGLQPRRVGDVTGDGRDDLMVLREDFPYGGSGHLFAGPLPVAASLDDAFAVFDHTLATGGGARPGDVAGDGRDDLVSHTSGADEQGGVLLYLDVDAGSHGELDADGEIEGTSPSDHLGAGLSLGGDLDGDGRHDLVAGAPGADGAAHEAGVTYLFPTLAAGDHAADEAVLRVLGVQEWEQSGSALIAGPDLDGDGLDDLLIGAPGYDRDGVTDAGAVYVISGAQLAAALAR